MAEYDPIKLAQDATTFAESEFGTHYLARLQKLKNDQLDIAMSDKFTDSQRAHAGTKAAVYEGELAYFNIAQTVHNADKSVVQKIRDNFKKRTKPMKKV